MINQKKPLCKKCKKPFIKSVWNKIYCSRACLLSAFPHAKYNNKDYIPFLKKRIRMDCVFCGKEFSPRWYNETTCSKECKRGRKLYTSREYARRLSKDKKNTYQREYRKIYKREDIITGKKPSKPPFHWKDSKYLPK